MKSKIFYTISLIAYLAMLAGLNSDSFQIFYELVSPKPETYNMFVDATGIIIGLMFIAMFCSWEHEENKRKFKG